MTNEGSSDAVYVGRILKPVGLRGEVRVEVASDAPERFAPGAVLYIEGNPYHILSMRPMRKGVVLVLAEVNSYSEAEALRGKAMYVGESQVPPAPQGSYYHYQVLGMRVYTREEEYLGEVTEIIQTGSNDVYVLTKGERGVLVPAVDSVVMEIDVKAGRMTVDLPEGL